MLIVILSMLVNCCRQLRERRINVIHLRSSIYNQLRVSSRSERGQLIIYMSCSVIALFCGTVLQLDLL